MFKLYTRILLLVGGLVTFSAHSANFGFLYDSAMQNFNDQDWSLLDAATDKALNAYPNGKELSWKNPSNNHSGYVVPLNTTVVNGHKCRQLKIMATDSIRIDHYTFRFCHINGDWKIDSH